MTIAVKTPKPVICRHSSHADWGLGMIVEETATRFYAEFEDAGRRRFLNLQRYRELMVPVDVEPKVASALIAKLSKSTSKPPPKPVAKKVKKIAVAAVVKEDVLTAAVVDEPEEVQADNDK